MLRTGEAGRMLGVGGDVVRRWARQGVISDAIVLPDGEMRVPESEITRLLTNKVCA
jgi:predicted site-specific integrase-resolvase